MEIDRQMEHVAESLRRLGILRTYLGHRAVLAAVQLALEDESRLHQVTKGIYMEAARRCGQSWSAVERNIRTAARRAWEANPRYLEQSGGIGLAHHRLGAVDSVGKTLVDQILPGGLPGQLRAHLKALDRPIPDTVQVIGLA